MDVNNNARSINDRNDLIITHAAAIARRPPKIDLDQSRTVNLGECKVDG